MTRRDFADVRRWHRNAALRARDAGFDIVYCYAAHGLTLPMQLLSRRHNDRTDEYGGSLANRVRFLRELIEDTKEAVGDDCAVAVRLAVDELAGPDGHHPRRRGAEIVAMLAELPDLWDVNVSGWSNDSATSRFAPEGHQEPYIAFVKWLTTKPVVGVGRYTSPDAMVSAVRRGVLDLIGAARPSIADPHLPRQDPRGPGDHDPRVHRLQHLRGHRSQVAADPVHTEPDDGRGVAARLAPRADPGAAHLERRSWWSAAGPPGWRRRAPWASAGTTSSCSTRGPRLGGRVDREALLPGLAAWRRVVDWRLGEIAGLARRRALPRLAHDRDRRRSTAGVRARGGGHRRDVAPGRSRALDRPARRWA